MKKEIDKLLKAKLFLENGVGETRLNGLTFLVYTDGTIKPKNENNNYEIIFVDMNEFRRKGVTIVNPKKFYRHYSIDYVILQTFKPLLEDPKNYNDYTVYHVDGKLSNNSLENLKWFARTSLHLGFIPTHKE